MAQKQVSMSFKEVGKTGLVKLGPLEVYCGNTQTRNDFNQFY